MAKIAAPSRKPTMFAPVRVRFRKMPRGSSGSLTVASMNSEPTIRMADSASMPMAMLSPQPSVSARVSP